MTTTVKDEDSMPPNSLLEEARQAMDGGMGLGLFNYLESYRKRLDEMSQLDDVAKSQGRTLDLTSVANDRKIKRTNRPREPGKDSVKRMGKSSGGKRDKIGNAVGYSYPPNVIDYSKFVSSLR